MKKVWLFFLILTALLLNACSRQASFEADGVFYTVDWEEKCLSDGENTYNFKQTTDDGKKAISVIYPNGVEVSRVYLSENVWTDNSENVDIEGYASFDSLVDIINDAEASFTHKINVPMILGGLLLVGIGVASMANPEGVWRIAEGWKYEGVEPSSFLLKTYTSVGLISTVSGTAIILGGILGAT